MGYVTGGGGGSSGAVTSVAGKTGVVTLASGDVVGDAPLASPTFTGTVTLPTGTVTSGMILDGTIVNADVNASAAIPYSKLSLGSSILATDFASSVAGAVGGIAKIVARTSDGTPITANVTLASDSVLQFAMGASDQWVGFAVPTVAAANSTGTASTEDVKFSIAAATGATGFWVGAGSAGGGGAVFIAAASNPGTVTTLGTAGASGIAAGTSSFPLYFYVAGDATHSGTIALQMAQNTSDNSTLTMKAGSFIVAWRIA